MKLNHFRDRSLIMGTFLSAQALQHWMRTSRKDSLAPSFLGSLILAALHFEGKSGGVGPSRLASAIGFSRSRISQELSKLINLGLIRRSVDSGDARLFSIVLTASGEKRAMETIKVISRLQTIVDRTLGERQAEAINGQLLKLAEVLASNKLNN